MELQARVDRPDRRRSVGTRVNVDVTSVVPGSLVTWGVRPPHPLVVVATKPVSSVLGSTSMWTLVRRVGGSACRTFTVRVGQTNSFTLVWSAARKNV